jgi:adenosylcobinamide-phosphate synthase
MDIYIPTIAFMIDCVIGDPRSNWHPVVLIGNLISFFEKKLLNSKDTPCKKQIAGAILVVFVLIITYSLTWTILYFANNINYWLAYFFAAIILSFTISPRSLAEAGIQIRNALRKNDLENARKKVGWIVGRDTDKLSVGEITRATVETIAENIVDGIISPLFYFIIGGAPLAVLYRAVNTMDSMIAYKNDKYIDFGKLAARIDDIFNFIPARITAILIVLISLVLCLDYKQSAKMILRDARKHPSPNSGYSEAGVAGALNIRLGGLNYYFGVASLRAYMGDCNVTIMPEHISKTIYIMYGVIILFIVLSFLALFSRGGL